MQPVNVVSFENVVHLLHDNKVIFTVIVICIAVGWLQD